MDIDMGGYYDVVSVVAFVVLFFLYLKKSDDLDKTQSIHNQRLEELYDSKEYLKNTISQKDKEIEELKKDLKYYKNISKELGWDDNDSYQDNTNDEETRKKPDDLPF